jgi:hypothetical protein
MYEPVVVADRHDNVGEPNGTTRCDHPVDDRDAEGTRVSGARSMPTSDSPCPRPGSASVLPTSGINAQLSNWRLHRPLVPPSGHRPRHQAVHMMAATAQDHWSHNSSAANEGVL